MLGESTDTASAEPAEPETVAASPVDSVSEGCSSEVTSTSILDTKIATSYPFSANAPEVVSGLDNIMG